MSMESPISEITVKEGARIIYNDGRLGHTEAFATVLVVSTDRMIVQFDDRAECTTIKFSDPRWMDFIKLPA